MDLPSVPATAAAGELQEDSEDYDEEGEEVMIFYYLYHPCTKKYLSLGRKVTGDLDFECSPYILAHFIATRPVGEFVLKNNLDGMLLPHQAKSTDWEEWKQ